MFEDRTPACLVNDDTDLFVMVDGQDPLRPLQTISRARLKAVFGEEVDLDRIAHLYCVDASALTVRLKGLKNIPQTQLSPEWIRSVDEAEEDMEAQL